MRSMRCGFLFLVVASFPAWAGLTVRSVSCRLPESFPSPTSLVQIERTGPVGTRAPYQILLQGNFAALDRVLQKAMPPFTGPIRAIRFSIPDAEGRCAHSPADPVIGSCTVPEGTEIELIPADAAEPPIRGVGRALFTIEKVTRDYLHDVAIGQVVSERSTQLRLHLVLRACSAQIDTIATLAFPSCIVVR